MLDFNVNKLYCGESQSEIKSLASTREKVICALSNINMKPWGLAIHWINHEGSEPVLINKVGKINTFENIAKK